MEISFCYCSFNSVHRFGRLRLFAFIKRYECQRGFGQGSRDQGGHESDAGQAGSSG